MPGPLDSDRQTTLMFGAGPGFAAGAHAATIIDETAQAVVVFPIDRFYPLDTKRAYFTPRPERPAEVTTTTVATVAAV